MVHGSGFMLQKSEFRVEGLGFGISGLYMNGGVAGRKEEASRYRVHRLGFRLNSFVFTVEGVRNSGLHHGWGSGLHEWRRGRTQRRGGQRGPES